MDEMRRFLKRILEVLEKEYQASMLHDSMDFSKLMVHVQQLEDSRKKRRVHEVRRPNSSDKTCYSRGGIKSTFEVHDQPRFKKGHQILGNSYSHSSETPRGGRAEPNKRNRGDVQRPRKECGKCGRIQSGECRLGTNACFGCRKSGHMVRDCPLNRGYARGNARPRPYPHNATTTKPTKTNKFNALKGREE